MIQTHRRKYIANLKEYLNKKQFFSRIGIYLAVGRFVATSFRKGPVLYEELSSRNIWTTGGIPYKSLCATVKIFLVNYVTTPSMCRG